MKTYVPGRTIKFANLSPSKYSLWEAMHRYHRLVHPLKQFWNWFCGVVFRAVTPDIINVIKCLPLNISFIFGNRKVTGD
jgi:hypothetical protein